MSQLLRGIFPVLQTPLDAVGELDEGSLARQVEFLLAAGAHGLVYLALGSDLQYLSDRERQRLTEVALRTAAGRLPVVVAVSAPSKAIAIEHASHAARAGATALMALPPYLAPGTADEILDYYQGDGIFGGAYGRWMRSELRRGASGFMPAAEVVDVYVAVWEAFAAGDEPTARAIFNRLLPLINQLLLLGLPVSKAVLVRRGVFATAGIRTPGSIALDEQDRHELDTLLADLRPAHQLQVNMLRDPREQCRPVARELRLHHELVLVDQSQLRQREWQRHAAHEQPFPASCLSC